MNFQVNTDMSRLCRVCVRDSPIKNMEYIYKSPDPLRPSLHTMLSAICATVFDSEEIHEQVARESFGMPKVVCTRCKLKILAAYDLHETCIENDRKLWEMIIVQRELSEDGVAIPCPETADDKPETKQSDLSGESTKEDPIDYLKVTGRILSMGAPTRTCELCMATFKAKRSFQKHLKTNHADSVKCCQDCTDVFFSNIELEDHRMFHLTGKKYSCEVCKKRFGTSTALRLHARKHVNYSPFKCSHCDRTFPSAPTLQLHMLKHTGQRNVPCERCPMRFFSKASLKSHMLTHTRERNFGCDICGSRFTSQHSLITHTAKHTGERPHGCTECSMRFFTSGHLKRHIRTHTGEKPYKCNYCDRAFAQSNDLIKHSRNHLGDKPYKCDLCQDSFRLISELRNHYEVHFKPGNRGASEILDKLNERYTNKKVMNHFTIVSALDRRFEEEKQQQRQKEEEENKVKVDAGKQGEEDVEMEDGEKYGDKKDRQREQDKTAGVKKDVC